MNGPMDAGADPFATWDGAYVLGALSPQDRAAFEEHLRSCEDCARAVGELAGLPGLLSQASPEALASVEPEQPPPELLAGLLDRVGRARRRRMLATVCATAVALAACLALVLTSLLGGTGGQQGQPPVAAAMSPVGGAPARANVILTDTDWGTQVQMECAYLGDGGGDYVLVALDEEGESRQLASWYAVPDDTATLRFGTTLRRADIRTLEVRTLDGVQVLRLQVTPGGDAASAAGAQAPVY
ncbi:zf-HC2 domain-containing protein [Streptomyces hoynatensis]|uniref:Anti-sigma factor n=1 Tax=Streptomyces hoynatensis TaxID=1141874 RepID=A0A3A9YRT9_9ACTN|nr:zf-HC2 domain-containing protein [Streptomyces hoynatensis]RKN37976.1 anti-sigma factor [Streptomyces hoynatensis]